MRRDRNPDQLVHSESFQYLIKKKKAFIIPATIFFILFYFFLPLSITFIPELVNRKFIYSFTWGWVLALLQFLMVWIIGILYYFKSKQFDQIVNKIRDQRSHL